jgi:hypothetical protein
MLVFAVQLGMWGFAAIGLYQRKGLTALQVLCLLVEVIFVSHISFT